MGIMDEARSRAAKTSAEGERAERRRAELSAAHTEVDEMIDVAKNRSYDRNGNAFTNLLLLEEASALRSSLEAIEAEEFGEPVFEGDE